MKKKNVFLGPWRFPSLSISTKYLTVGGCIRFRLFISFIVSSSFLLLLLLSFISFPCLPLTLCIILLNFSVPSFSLGLLVFSVSLFLFLPIFFHFPFLAHFTSFIFAYLSFSLSLTVDLSHPNNRYCRCYWNLNGNGIIIILIIIINFSSFSFCL